MTKDKSRYKTIVHETKEDLKPEGHHFACTKELKGEITKKAYELYESRGCRSGRDWDDWFEAEKIVQSQFASSSH